MTDAFEERIRILLETQGTTGAVKDIDVVKRSVLGLGTAGMEMTDSMKNAAATMKTMNREATRFKAEWLGIMFGGMQLQRVFGGLFKTLITDYRAFTKEASTPLANSLTALEANWKFLKFAIVEASGPFLIRISDFLSSMARNIAKIDPSILSAAMASIAALAVVGGGAAVLGQAMLLINSISLLKSSAATTEAINSMNGLDGAVMDKGTTFLATLGKTVGAGITIYAAFQTVKSLSSKEPQSMGDILKTSLAAGLGVGLWTMNPGAGLLASATVALLLTIDSASKENVKKELGELNRALQGTPEESLLSSDSLFKSVATRFSSADTGFFGEIFQADTRKLKGLIEDREEIIKNYQAGLITYDQASKQVEGLFGGAIDLQTLDEMNARYAITAEQSKLVAENAAALDTTIKTALPASVENFIASEDAGLVGIKNELNNSVLKAEALNASLAKPITKTVTIKYKEEGSSNSTKAVNASFG